MRKMVLFGFVMCFLLLCPHLAHSETGSNPNDWTPDYWSGSVNIFLGIKALDEEDWEPVEIHDQIGIVADVKPRSWPVSLAVDFLASSDDQGAISLAGIGTVSLEAEAKTRELDLGVRKAWDDTRSVHPYFGGGIGVFWAELEGRTTGSRTSDDDTGIGLWIGAGVIWVFYEHANVGVDFRWSRSEVTLYGVDVEAGGYHTGLLLGYRW